MFDAKCDFFVKKITIVFYWFEDIKKTSAACIFSKLRRLYCLVKDLKYHDDVFQYRKLNMFQKFALQQT